MFYKKLRSEIQRLEQQVHELEERHSFAICDSMEKALEEQKKVRGFSQITEVEMNKFKPVYLGGYEE